MRWWIILSAAIMTQVHAGEKEMHQALAEWDQQMAEYQAALSLIETEAQRAELPMPSTDELAHKIWRAVSGVTRTEKEEWETTGRDKNGKRVVKTHLVRHYEFEEDWAAPAVVWLVQHPGALAEALGGNAQEIAHYSGLLLDSILRKHYASPLIAQACPSLAEITNHQVYGILEKIYSKNADPTAKGCAALAMSIMLANPALTSSAGGQARARSKRIYYIKQALNEAPSEAMFGAKTLTEVAEEQIYRLRNLSIGSIPPRLTVYGADGQPAVFPQEGKPNLIIFWSPQEDVGLTIMSKQQALMKKYPGLALCPIITREDAEACKELLRESDVSLYYVDDTQGTTGKNYRVETLPMAVLTDARARILYIGYPNMQLQTELDTCFNSAAAPAEPLPAPQRPGPKAGSDEPPALREMPQF